MRSLNILRGAGLRPIHNRAGANLLSGLYSTVAQATDWHARPRGDIGLFEVDEATVPRALEHIEPRVLLLDDFTARVDSNTERKILENVRQNYPGITLLSVTQKIASVEDYDQILLLMEGEILAKGTHAEGLNPDRFVALDPGVSVPFRPHLQLAWLPAPPGLWGAS